MLTNTNDDNKSDSIFWEAFPAFIMIGQGY